MVPATNKQSITVELLTRAASGHDAEDTGALVDFVYERVAAVLKPDSPDLMDAFNTAYLKVLGALHRGAFDPGKGGSPAAWVSTIAVRVAIDHARQSSRRWSKVYDKDVGELEDPCWIDSTEEIAHEQMARLVDALLLDLDESQRAIIVLRYWDDLSQQEIADELGIPLGTVKSKLSRASAKLKQSLVRALPREAALLHKPAGTLRR